MLDLSPRRTTVTWLIGMLSALLALNLSAAPVPLLAQGTTNQVCVSVGANLASVDAGQAALLDGILGSLLNRDLNLSVNDLNALAQGQLDLGDLLDTLQIQNGLPDLASTLGADLSLDAVLATALAGAESSGNASVAGALGTLRQQVGGLAGMIQIGDLFALDTPAGALIDGQLNALDLATALVELYSFNYVAGPTLAMSIAGNDLGLGSSVGTVELMAQLLAPPQIVSGATGLTFAAPPLRLLVHSNLLNTALDLSVLDGLLEGALGLVIDVEVAAQLGDLSLLTDIAGGAGVLSTVNLASGVVQAQVTPGIAALYLGEVASSLAFDRNHNCRPAMSALGQWANS